MARVGGGEERKPLRGWDLKTISMNIDNQCDHFSSLSTLATLSLSPISEKESISKDFSCRLHVIRARCRNMLCYRNKLRNIVVAIKEV